MAKFAVSLTKNNIRDSFGKQLTEKPYMKRAKTLFEPAANISIVFRKIVIAISLRNFLYVNVPASLSTSIAPLILVYLN